MTTSHYPDSSIYEICQRFSIDVNHIESIREWLNDMGIIYQLQKTTAVSRQSKSQIFDPIDKVANKAGKLAKLIRDLQAESHNALAIQMGILPRLESNLDSDFHKPELEYRPTDAGVSSLHNLADTLEELYQQARDARSQYPNKSAGPKKNYPLYQWAMNFHTLWVTYLTRDFTLYQVNGEPLSDTAVFARDVFTFVDPKVPFVSLYHQLEESGKTKKSNFD